MEILKKILNDKVNRKKLIREFQSQIWNSSTSLDILKDLAHDLDFYEPDEIFRKDDPSYYGDERLEREILLTIQKLEKFNSI